MVYCTKCGAQNADDATVCANCGQALYPTRPARERREREACFGLPSHWGSIIVGLFIILIGIGFFFQHYYAFSFDVVWPLFLVFIGILIIAGALYRTSRR